MKTKSAKQYFSNGLYEFPIGTKFIYCGEKYIVEVGGVLHCCGCCAMEVPDLCDKFLCLKKFRKDRKNVIIKKI